MKLIMLLIVIGFIACSLIACRKDLSSNPVRPKKVRGWQEFSEQGIYGVGEFLLKKGEAIENGKLKIELVEIVLSRQYNDPWAEPALPPQAIFRFVDIVSGKAICDVKIGKQSNQRLVNFNFPTDKYGIDTISVRDINTIEGWVWFEFWR